MPNRPDGPDHRVVVYAVLAFSGGMLAWIFWRRPDTVAELEAEGLIWLAGAVALGALGLKNIIPRGRFTGGFSEGGQDDEPERKRKKKG